MKRYYAKKGSIPKPYEVWLPVGDKAHLMMVHLIDVKRVREFIPEELEIVSVLPGKTLGVVFMTSMGPDSTLPYHEFIVAPALVKAKKRGFFVTHIYVDNEKSQTGGKMNFGLDKQMAEFEWNWESGKSGCVTVGENGKKIFSIRYKAQLGKLPLRLKGGVFSILENELIWCNNIFKARFGVTKVEYEIYPDTALQSNLKKIGLNKPVLSVMGEKMKGYMGDETQVVAFLPNRKN